MENVKWKMEKVLKGAFFVFLSFQTGQRRLKSNESFNFNIFRFNFPFATGFFLGGCERMTTFAPNFRRETKVLVRDVFNLQYETIPFGAGRNDSCSGGVCQ
jgi:hypothetical protein